MGIYQVDTLPENEVHICVGQQFDNFRDFFLVWVLYEKQFFRTISYSFTHYILASMSLYFFLSFFPKLGG